MTLTGNLALELIIMKVNLEIVNFREELKRVEREIKRQANMEIGQRVDFATKTLKLVTPVDTGKARKGWKNKTYRSPDGYLDGSIVNEVEYMSRLNKGHSKQAPKYFIEQVLTKIGILTPN
jgi:hypothetical protein